MIIQGSNAPIVLVFTEETFDIKDISVALVKDNKVIAKPDEVLKVWSKDDIILDEEEFKVLCPFTQEETLNLPKGSAFIEVKWLTSTGEVWCSNITRTSVEKRYDSTILTENEDGDTD